MTFAPISETLNQKSWRGPAKGIYLSLRIEKILSEVLPRLQSPEATADGGQAQLPPPPTGKIKMSSYREGKLTLLTPSPAISQELYLNSTVITKKLNKLLGGKVVEKIGFRIEA